MLTNTLTNAQVFPQTVQIVGSQFVVQTDYALDQRAQDNKFVESGLRNWALANMEKDL